MQSSALVLHTQFGFFFVLIIDLYMKNIEKKNNLLEVFKKFLLRLEL